MAEAPGSEIGHYRIVGPVGRGGFATVYRANDLRFDVDVALKVLAENHSLDPDIRERFLAEARLLRRIDSIHVVRLTDIGETDRRQPFMVLDFADRGSLRDRLEPLLAAGTQIDAPTLLVIACALADALTEVHRHNVVHRDVSPGNLLLTSVATGELVAEHRTSGLINDGVSAAISADERLVLADLGFAKDLAEHSGFTMGGGTSTFGAPEQQSVGRVDRRADIFAASSVLAWAATGDASGATTYAHPLYGASLTAVYRMGMATDPDGRHPTAGAWKCAVETALAVGAEPVAATPPRVGSSDGGVPDSLVQSTEPVGRTANRFRLLGVLATAALVIGLATGWFAAGFGPNDERQTIEQLVDGRVRISAESGSVAAALFAPRQVTANQPMTIEAGANGAVDFVWILPNGELFAFADTVTFTPDEGAGTIALIVTGAGGDSVELHYDFDT